MFEATAWGLLAGSSLLLGALLVMLRHPTPLVLGLVLGFGAGVLISAVSYELVEEAVGVAGGSRGAALGFVAGALVFFLGDTSIARLGQHSRDSADSMVDSSRNMRANPLSIVLGTVLDGVPESAVLGLTLLQTGEIGVAMLVAVFVSNVPEAVAATSDLLDGGWPRARIAGLWLAVAVASALSAGIGYVALDGAAPATVAFIFAFAGGAILAMLATSMIPEAYELAGRPVGLLVTFGFAVSFAISFLSE